MMPYDWKCRNCKATFDEPYVEHNHEPEFMEFGKPKHPGACPACGSKDIYKMTK